MDPQSLFQLEEERESQQPSRACGQETGEVSSALASGRALGPSLSQAPFHESAQAPVSIHSPSVY